MALELTRLLGVVSEVFGSLRSSAGNCFASSNVVITLPRDAAVTSVGKVSSNHSSLVSASHAASMEVDRLPANSFFTMEREDYIGRATLLESLILLLDTSLFQIGRGVRA